MREPSETMILGGQELSLGLSYKVLDAIARVPVTTKGSKEQTGFCPFKLLRGEQDPSFTEACAVIAAAAITSTTTLRAEDIAKLRPGARALNVVLVEYAIKLMMAFSPEESTGPKAGE